MKKQNELPKSREHNPRGYLNDDMHLKQRLYEQTQNSFVLFNI